MFLFGFKSTLNVGSSNKKEPEITSGVYRLNRGEFSVNGSLSDPPKTISPSMVKLPGASTSSIRPSKSTSDLVQNKNTLANDNDVNLRKSTPNVSNTPSRAPNKATASKKPATKQPPANKASDKNQKKVQKQQENERKKREKIAEQERKNQEKLKKEREKQMAKQMEKERKERIKAEKKKPALPKSQPPSAQPQPAQRKPRANPLAQTNTTQPTASQSNTAQPESTSRIQYSTNTLDSSISKSSGPPPYTETPKSTETVPSKNDTSANVSFGKPVEPDSWDMISQHRQEMNRPTTVIGSSRAKQRVMDLQYRGNAPNLAARSNDLDTDA